VETRTGLLEPVTAPRLPNRRPRSPFFVADIRCQRVSGNWRCAEWMAGDTRRRMYDARLVRVLAADGSDRRDGRMNAACLVRVLTIRWGRVNRWPVYVDSSTYAQAETCVGPRLRGGDVSCERVPQPPTSFPRRRESTPARCESRAVPSHAIVANCVASSLFARRMRQASASGDLRGPPPSRG
jgi:hypothetical protein